jgi:hypothetical protein
MKTEDKPTCGDKPTEIKPGDLTQAFHRLAAAIELNNKLFMCNFGRHEYHKINIGTEDEQVFECLYCKKRNYRPNYVAWEP